LDASKIKRAQKALRAKTETETIERAVDLAITEQKRNRSAWQVTERFLESGAEIRDVWGTDGRDAAPHSSTVPFTLRRFVVESSGRAQKHFSPCAVVDEFSCFGGTLCWR
jgi:hypothetical protein